jgi:serine/threonine protein kinase
VPAARAGLPRSENLDVMVGGRFVLEHCLRTSTHAEVWRARDPQHTTVAIKVAKSPQSRARLSAEHACLDRYSHAAILRLLAWVDDASHTALVTEYLDGGDLVSLAGFAARHWLRPMAEVAEALAYLHAHSVVHRDVKARNVLLDSAGHARLIDFGSAAEVGSPRTLGSTTAAHRYADAGTVSAADDVFAFSVLLYELMAGRLPFGGEPVHSRRRAAPPLATELRNRPGLAALERHVLEILLEDAAEESSMRTLRDRIKSAVSEETELQ